MKNIKLLLPLAFLASFAGVQAMDTQKSVADVPFTWYTKDENGNKIYHAAELTDSSDISFEFRTQRSEAPTLEQAGTQPTIKIDPGTGLPTLKTAKTIVYKTNQDN